MTLAWDDLVLRYNPYADDGGARILSDRIVTARKAGPCCLCGEPIEPGSRIRLARSWTDNGKAIEARHAVRRAQA